MSQTVVVGAGLAGLSTAYHLPTPSVVYEKTPFVGGTARSYTIDGFTFDYTGHLLHLHTEYTKQLIPKLLGDNIVECQRSAWIFSQGAYTRYPFQANLFGLPQWVLDDCLQGLRLAQQNTEPISASLPFDQWVDRVYGRGFNQHFFGPYNLKLYGTLEGMTAEWCGQFVPKVSLAEVEEGAKRDRTDQYGYNSTFFYPKKGGIQVLAESLAKGLSVQLNRSLHKVYWRSRIATFLHGATETSTGYNDLVSTIPLPELVKRLDPFPEELAEPLSQLKCRPITCINMGVKRPNISDKSWIYFPKNDYIFYRIGFPANFTPHAAPEGCSSCYIEIGGEVAEEDQPKILGVVKNDMIQAGLLQEDDEVPVAHFLPIKYAYVLYTPQRQAAVATILEWLRKHRIQSIGRYGTWSYSFMEQAILDGKQAAELLGSKKRV